MLLSSAASAAESKPSILAVFDIEDRGSEIKPEVLSNLTDYLAARLSESGFQLIPRADIKSSIRQSQTESYAECYDQACQIELGKELAAEKTVSTQILKIATTCQVTSVIYDLRTASTERAATSEAGCDEASLLGAIKEIVPKLVPKSTEVAVAPPPPAQPPDPPPPVAPPPPAKPDPAPAPEEPVTTAEKEQEKKHRIWGVGASAMVEFFPKFGAQQSVFTGARLHVGVYRPVYLILHVGYTAAGERPGNGDDGVMVGGGVEGAFPIGDTFIEIIGRGEVNGVVTQTSDLEAGTLTGVAALLGGGVRAFRIIELGVITGLAPHKAFAFGVTAQIGFVY